MEFRATERLKSIDPAAYGRKSLGEYLHGVNRCAVAHANQLDQSLNPDDSVELLRIALDLDVARALADEFITSELGLRRGRP